MSGENNIRKLVQEIDRYLSTLPDESVRKVRAGIRQWGDGPFKAVKSRPCPLPVHLDDALALVSNDGHVSLAAAISQASAHLHWVTYNGYPPEQIGESFTNGHCFATLIGEGCGLDAMDFDLGLFLIAPNILYRDHQHAAPELYAPLTGPHGWRFQPGDALAWKPAHEPIWNPPYQPHATKVGDVPFLCIFGWTENVNAIATVVPADDWLALEAQSPPATVRKRELPAAAQSTQRRK